jgi:hypothetical protein
VLNTYATSPPPPPPPRAPKVVLACPWPTPPLPSKEWPAALLVSKPTQPPSHQQTPTPTQAHICVCVCVCVCVCLQVWNPTKDTNVPKLEEASTFQGHFLGVVSMSASADGRMCAVSSLDGRLRIWNLEDKNLVKIVDPGPVEAWGVSFHPKVGGRTHAALIPPCYACALLNATRVSSRQLPWNRLPRGVAFLSAACPSASHASHIALLSVTSGRPGSGGEPDWKCQHLWAGTAGRQARSAIQPAQQIHNVGRLLPGREPARERCNGWLCTRARRRQVRPQMLPGIAFRPVSFHTDGRRLCAHAVGKIIGML